MLLLQAWQVDAAVGWMLLLQAWQVDASPSYTHMPAANKQQRHLHPVVLGHHQDTHTTSSSHNTYGQTVSSSSDSH
jgi:hypothetical protein